MLDPQTESEHYKQAFPDPLIGKISLRDWFAGMALQAWITSFGDDSRPVPDSSAKLAYEMADAMLAERGKP